MKSEAEQARQALEQLRAQHEAMNAKLMQSLPQVFNLSIDEILSFKTDQETGTISGQLVSGGKTYNWSMGREGKSLTEA